MKSFEEVLSEVQSPKVSTKATTKTTVTKSFDQILAESKQSSLINSYNSLVDKSKKGSISASELKDGIFEIRNGLNTNSKYYDSELVNSLHSGLNGLWEYHGELSKSENAPNLLANYKSPDEVLDDAFDSIAPTHILRMKERGERDYKKYLSEDASTLKIDLDKLETAVNDYGAMPSQHVGYEETARKSSEAEKYLNSLGITNLLDAKKVLAEKREYYNKVVDAQTNDKAKKDAAAQQTTESNLAGTYEAEAGLEKFERDEREAESKKPSTLQSGIVKGFITSSDTPIGTAIDTVSYDYSNDDSYRKPTNEWSDAQKKVFGYYYYYDPSKAFSYAESLNNAINKAKTDKQDEKNKETFSKNVGTMLGGAGLAILTAPTAIADFLDNAIEYSARGTITEKNAHSPFDFGQSIISGVSQNLNEKYGTIDENVPIIGGKGLGDLYNLGTSIAQSASYTVFGPAAPIIALISYFGQGATSGVDDALSRGATGGQALLYGAALGVAEGLAEKVGIDNLFKVGASKTAKKFIKNVTKLGAAEGLEEGLTSTFNEFADRLIMQDKSNFNAMVKDFENKGFSTDAAKNKAWTKTAENTAYDMLGGFISGGVHGGSTTLIKGFIDKSLNKSNSSMTSFDSNKNVATNNLTTPSGTKAISPQAVAKLNSQVKGLEGLKTTNANGKAGKRFNIVAADKNPALITELVKSQDEANNFTDDQIVLKNIGKVFGVDVAFANINYNYTDSQGNVKTESPEGFYSKGANAIVLNTNSNVNHRPVEYIFKHELTHRIFADSKLGNAFAVQVINSPAFQGYLEDKGFKTSEEWQNYIINDYANRGIALGEEGNPDSQKLAAIEEITANFVGDMLFGGNTKITTDFLNTLNPVQKKSFSEKVKELFAKIADYFKNHKNRKEYAEIKRLERNFLKAAGEVVETDATTETDTETEAKNNGGLKASFSSITHSFFGENGAAVEQMESGEYKNTEGYKNYVDECVDSYKQSHRGVNDDVARAEIESSIDGIVKVAVAAKKAGYDILDDAKQRTLTDSKKRLLFSSLEPNSDYFTSSDISTICDKRKNFTEIYEEIVRRETEQKVPKDKRFFNNIDNYFYLHSVLADKGLTVPCVECYVDSMRKNLAPMAESFIELINETDVGNLKNSALYNDKGEIKKGNSKLRTKVLAELRELGWSPSDITPATLTTAEGLAQLKLEAPLIYEAFNSYYGQSKPKMPRNAVPFRFGELRALLIDKNGNINKTLVKRINDSGGFRLQSYSDFQVENYVDVLQVLFEAGTLGLSGHAYTKVPAFLQATSNTNLKRNISIFMYKDGNTWVVNKADSFPGNLEDISTVANSDKSGNTGIIAVSQNEDMAAYVMADDRIAYGIPYHKSGNKMDTVRGREILVDGKKVKVNENIKDHTKQQYEVWGNDTNGHKAGNKVKKPIVIYDFWDFTNKDNLSKNDLIKKNLSEYLNRCKEKGYLPRFREYVVDNEDVLNNILAYRRSLGYEGETLDDISFVHEGTGFRVPYGYYKFLTDYGIFTPDGKASPAETLSLKNYDFDEAVNFFKDKEGVKKKELLQQFSNDGERQRVQDYTIPQLESLLEEKRNAVVDTVRPKQSTLKASLPPTDSEGNKLSPEQREYFKDTKVRDVNGNLLLVYHGTPNAGFNVFSYDFAGTQGGKNLGYGHYFTDKRAEANAYTQGLGEVKSGYLNITNAIIAEEKTIAKELFDVVPAFVIGRLETKYGTLENAVAQYSKWSNGEVLSIFPGDTKLAPKDMAYLMKKLGYDGVISNTEYGNEYVAFDSNQFKYADNKTPTSNPDIRFSLPENLDSKSILESVKNGEMTIDEADELISNKKVMTPKEIMELTEEDADITSPKKTPKKQGKGDGESNLAESVEKSDIITDEVKKEIANNTYVKNYGTTTNKATLEEAMRELDEGGAERAQQFLNIDPKYANAVDVAVGFILLENYQRKGDFVTAETVIEKLREIGTISGQTVQIFSILGRFSPDTMAYYAQRELDKALEHLKEIKGNAWIEKNKDKFKLTEQEISVIKDNILLTQQYVDGDRNKAIALGTINSIVQNKIPPSVSDSIRTWQRISLLLNVKTNLRNIIGNGLMAVTYVPSDFFGNLVDKALAKKSGFRTTGNVRLRDKGLYKAFGKGFADSYDDFKRGINTKLVELDRYGTSSNMPGKSFKEDTKFATLNFAAKFCNKLDSFTSFCLEAGDRTFFEMWFYNSIKNQMIANKVDVPTAEMLEVAKNEALQRTYQNNSWLSGAALKIRDALNTVSLEKIAKKFGYDVGNFGLGDIVIKYAKTPANVAQAIIDFSPVGFIGTATDLAKFSRALKDGKVTPQMQRNVSNSFGKALTGTLIYGLVYALAAADLLELTGGGDEDKDVSAFERYVLGVPTYSMKIFGKDVTYAWAQPLGAVLATVADYNKRISEEENPDYFNALRHAISTGMDTFTEQSFLKGVYELFSAASFAEYFAKVSGSEISTLIPTFFSQMASAFDPYRRDSFNSNDDVMTSILKSCMMRIPGLRMHLPKSINVLGEEVPNSEYVWSHGWLNLAAFVRPWNTYEKSESTEGQYLYELFNATGDKGVIPPKAPYYIKKSDIKMPLTSEEKNKFQSTMAKTSLDIITVLLEDEEFVALNDYDKAKVVKSVYNYGRDVATSELNFSYEMLREYVGKDKNNEYILTEETYNNLTPEAMQILILDETLTKKQKAARKDLNNLAKVFINSAK